jgi:hypothetical protein
MSLGCSVERCSVFQTSCGTNSRPPKYIKEFTADLRTYVSHLSLVDSGPRSVTDFYSRSELACDQSDRDGRFPFKLYYSLYEPQEQQHYVGITMSPAPVGEEVSKPSAIHPSKNNNPEIATELYWDAIGCKSLSIGGGFDAHIRATSQVYVFMVS